MYNKDIICPEKSAVIEQILKEKLGYIVKGSPDFTLWDKFFSHYKGEGMELRVPNKHLGFGCKLRIVHECFLYDIEPCPVKMDYYPEDFSPERDTLLKNIMERIYTEAYILPVKEKQ